MTNRQQQPRYCVLTDLEPDDILTIAILAKTAISLTLFVGERNIGKALLQALQVKRPNLVKIQCFPALPSNSEYPILFQEDGEEAMDTGYDEGKLIEEVQYSTQVLVLKPPREFLQMDPKVFFLRQQISFSGSFNLRSTFDMSIETREQTIERFFNRFPAVVPTWVESAQAIGLDNVVADGEFVVTEPSADYDIFCTVREQWNKYQLKQVSKGFPIAVSTVNRLLEDGNPVLGEICTADVDSLYRKMKILVSLRDAPEQYLLSDQIVAVLLTSKQWVERVLFDGYGKSYPKFKEWGGDELERDDVLVAVVNRSQKSILRAAVVNECEHAFE
jgi:hypothetical protein